MWYRVFGQGDREPPPDALLAHLNRVAVVQGHFHGDDAGWFHADLVCDDTSLSLDRYTTDEDGIRAELNTWAAFVESNGNAATQTPLMEHLIQTKQLFTLQRPDEASCHSLCIALCEYLAQMTNGVCQIDGEGFFTADGGLLLRET
jgi:hypothetical protein